MICQSKDVSLKSPTKRRPAVFLDRDGTLTRYRGFITRPEQVELCVGAASAVMQLRAAGFCCVLVSNQSAIGRGILTEERLSQINAQLMRRLYEERATLDAMYWCPDLPGVEDETLVENRDRKPGPGMLLAAASDLNLDLSASWMVGDRISDVLAGANAGCQCIRICSGHQYPLGVPAISVRYDTVADFPEAVKLILSSVASPITKEQHHARRAACFG